MPRCRPAHAKATRGLARNVDLIDLPAPCVALLPDSTPCGREPIQTGSPVDLCSEHARAVFMHVQGLIRDAPYPDIPNEINARRFATTGGRPMSDAGVDYMNGWESVVYYASSDGLIKIGTSTNVRYRFRDYPPTTRLLAIEEGGFELEKQRHREFAGDRITRGREWFRPSVELLAHIRTVADSLIATPS